METYNNDYTPQEDHLLWELHEIRHALHRELSQKTIQQVNTDALRKYRDWLQSQEIDNDRCCP